MLVCASVRLAHVGKMHTAPPSRKLRNYCAFSVGYAAPKSKSIVHDVAAAVVAAAAAAGVGVAVLQLIRFRETAHRLSTSSLCVSVLLAHSLFAGASAKLAHAVWQFQNKQD